MRASQDASANVPVLEHWIGGRTAPPSTGTYFDSLNPIDDSAYARAAKGDEHDVAAAVSAADRAFQAYGTSLPGQREQWLIRAAEILQRAVQVVRAVRQHLG